MSIMTRKLLLIQSGGPTPVINASLAGAIQEARRSGLFAATWGAVHGLEGVLQGRLADLTQLSDEQIEQLARQPAAALRSTRRKISAQDLAQVLQVLHAAGITDVITIGGNGSMWVADQLSQLATAQGYPLTVVGVPKTIDNDLAGTDHCPGYGSAARFIMLATRNTGLDLEAMNTFDDVTILEVMGRDAGWLAAAAALAKCGPNSAPHLVYVSEIPFDQSQFLTDLKTIHDRLGRVYVVVSEGLRDRDGHFVGINALGQEADAMGRTVHSLSNGVGNYLNGLIKEELGLQSRCLRPGLVGRADSASASDTDRTEAVAAGRSAVQLLAADIGGVMVTLERESDEPYSCYCGTIPFSDVSEQVRHLPRRFMNEAGNFPSEAFIRYAAPLIGLPLPDPIRFTSADYLVTPDAAARNS